MMAETGVRSETTSARRALPVPSWHVVLWDDNDHSYPYVQAMMIELSHEKVRFVD